MTDHIRPSYTLVKERHKHGEVCAERLYAEIRATTREDDVSCYTCEGWPFVLTWPLQAQASGSVSC